MVGRGVKAFVFRRGGRASSALTRDSAQGDDPWKRFVWSSVAQLTEELDGRRRIVTTRHIGITGGRQE
ncbi:MAG: hypothetical protein JRN21_08110 [Nitrososphaerota archaeon]|nr:hypothetical protein [Nitrososphaerota archaeon]